MTSKDYEIILKALNNLEEKDEDTKKLIKKIELFNESDKLRIDYQNTMDKIGKEINDLMKEN